ncbi:MAG: hypothetical protein LBK91_06995 [Synergistaceae bacterium]|nr:hypothetical protein [Synergistaceae bacterium]
MKIIAAGPASCLRYVYFTALGKRALKQLVLCRITQIEYALGRSRAKILDTIRETLRSGGARGILLYVSCADIMTGVDFEDIVSKVDNPLNIPVKIFRRGPMEKRKEPAIKRLRLLLDDIGQKIDGSVGGARLTENEDAVFLPPLASDFAGICSMLNDWSGDILLYGPGGCASGIVEYEKAHGPMDFSFTKYNDIQASLGHERYLEEALRPRLKTGDEGAHVLMGTPVPYIAGFDFGGFSKALSRHGSPPTFCLPSNGFKDYSAGIENCLATLGKSLLPEGKEKERQILVLGCSAMEPVSRDKLEPAVAALENNGFFVNVWGEGGLQTVKRAVSACLCWVVSPAGEKLAEWLKRECNIPWFSDLPIGRGGMRRFMDTVSLYTNTVLERKEQDFPESRPEPGNGTNVLIVSEPLTGLGIQSCLRQDFAHTDSAVAVYGMKRFVSRFGRDGFGRKVIYFERIEEIKDMIRGADILVADPIFDSFAKRWGHEPLFIPVPYPALSGNLHSRLQFDLLGEEGYRYFHSALNNNKTKEEM